MANYQNKVLDFWCEFTFNCCCTTNCHCWSHTYTHMHIFLRITAITFTTAALANRHIHHVLWKQSQRVKRHSRSCPCQCCHTYSTDSQSGLKSTYVAARLNPRVLTPCFGREPFIFAPKNRQPCLILCYWMSKTDSCVCERKQECLGGELQMDRNGI